MLTDTELVIFEILKAKAAPVIATEPPKSPKERYADELKETEKRFIKSQYLKAIKKNLQK
jgi:hypothetical protein